jgi:hypothetical protein
MDRAGLNCGVAVHDAHNAAAPATIAWFAVTDTQASEGYAPCDANILNWLTGIPAAITVGTPTHQRCRPQQKLMTLKRLSNLQPPTSNPAATAAN